MTLLHAAGHDEALKESIMQVDFPHYHSHNNQLFPRTSSILKLHPDSLHQKIVRGDYNHYFLREVFIRAEEGNRIHNAARIAIHNLMRDNRIAYECDVPEPEDATPIETLNERERTKFRKCIQWILQNDLTILRPPELRVVSPSLAYGGSPDLVCAKGNHTFVIDFKTGQHVYEPCWLQVQSYADLVEKEHNMTTDRIGILLLGTDSEEARLTYMHHSGLLQDQFTHLKYDWYRMFPEPFQTAAV